ncbi:clathrin light chain B isoform X2 [Aplysia californica]|uniref:Clathrin light chain n=1 Tax=Aplysia californica TaxID=6500 RepID=A0ABM1VUA9_APLCA|nr:clathrin light chain B isoform X2 [Aplysia californica]
MADFDAFETAPSGEVDPAADFLAREQSELAGLEDDNFAAADSQPEAAQGFDAFGSAEGTDAPSGDQQNLADNGLGDFEMIGGAGDGQGTGVVDDGLLGGGLAGGSSDGLNSSATNGPSSMYEAISQHDTLRAEPEKIKIWREEQKARLEKKDSEEDKKKLELKEVAKKELDDWYKHHTEQLEKTKENNRAAEDAFVKERDEKVSGQAWEKITRLCEFNPKNSKTTKDVGRFRGILLQLKQTPLVR